MNRLIAADTHFTPKPLDEYRWGLFGYLKDWAIKYDVDEIWILGDLTDAKEGHSAEFVNRLVNHITELSEVAPVFILRGNHDYAREHVAFFEFLRKLPNVYWIDRPTTVYGVRAFPHSKNPAEDWATLLDDLDEYEYAFFHQCFVGSRSSMGHILDGTDLDLTKLKKCKVYAGDIHLPQTVRGIEYVGSPYPTTYGDRFLGRCLLETPEGRTQLHYPTIQKCTLVVESVSEIYDAHVYPGDQVKIRYKISKKDRAEWTNIKNAIKAACDDLGVVLGGTELVTDVVEKVELKDSTAKVTKTSEKAILTQFAHKEDLPDDYLDVALTILKEE
ncbi:putative DNA repair exonuclease [Vibrio phage vB_VpaS_KF5]|uniref:Putative DNA repair exonuclease n=1 Tax=Vibrio phage vB_VpaS_KF5 TaxID=2041476 RepID=A0A384X2X6_9CAUD|nr:putative DNA repair exonuclease [Vibrio phage vB_VpaS_KF5]UYD21379.1 SbcD-like subunit of palindrome specific endonuclease [Vibrio phage 27Ua.3]UYE96194.1 SbcD-like subunit of palindrome specific endonuclease [Vibrio phage 31Fb.4]UYE96311.1 SbcD-like subunit of palindrome specific endonuclease [Vibrio phage 33Fb.4]